MSGLGFQTSLILGTVCSFMLRLVSLLNERIPFYIEIYCGYLPAMVGV